MKFGFATSTLQEDPVSSCFSFEPTSNGKIRAIPISNWALMLMDSINPKLRDLWNNRKARGEKNFEKKLSNYFQKELSNYKKAIAGIDMNSEGNLYFHIQVDIGVLLEVLDQKSNHEYSYIFIKVIRELIIELSQKYSAKTIIFVNQFSSELIREDHNIDIITKLVNGFRESFQLNEEVFSVSTLASRDLEGWKYFIDRTIQFREYGRVESIRISIEWAELFPQKGEFNDHAAEKYKEIINYIHSKDIEVIICTDHMSWPLWLGDGNGWSSRDSIEEHDLYINTIFRYFQENVVLHKISKVIVFNEPYSFLPAAYLDAVWPPYKSQRFLPYTALVGLFSNYYLGRKLIKILDRNNQFVNALENTSRAHVSAFRIIKGIEDSIPVTSSNIHTKLEALPLKSPLARGLEYFASKFRNVWWKMTVKKDLRNLVYDFEAIQLYAKMYINISHRPRSLMQNVINMNLENAYPNGWLFYPENFLAIIFERTALFLDLLADYKVIDEDFLPKLSFTEFGGPVSATRNLDRIKQILEIIKSSQEYIPLELDMALKWSPVDNFEWDLAYNNLLRFGDMNYDFTQKKSITTKRIELNYSDKWLIRNAKKLQKSLHSYYDLLLEEDADDLFVEKIDKYAKKMADFIKTNS